MRLHALVSALAVAALANVSALGNTASATPDLPDDFSELRAKDTRIQRLGYTLAVGNAPYCSVTRPSLGLMLHDIAVYEEDGRLRSALGLTGDIAVQVVVPGSPAVGVLTPDMTIASIEDTAISDIPFEEKRKWSRMTELNALLDQSLDKDGSVTLGLQNGRTVELKGTPACATRFEVGGIGKRAVADGERVVIGNKFPGLAYDDPELAAVMAHELAHNVLGHRALLDAQGRGRKLVRATEREADRLAPWLLANAGFEPEAALRFMQTWGPDHSGGWLLRKRTHDGWDERAEMIAAEAALVRAHLEADGTADWKTRFRREVETQKP